MAIKRVKGRVEITIGYLVDVEIDNVETSEEAIEEATPGAGTSIVGGHTIIEVLGWLKQPEVTEIPGSDEENDGES
jgi:hypothetical protein